MTDLMRNEVRLGLVLYGGVSLAIYINGVAQEFWNIVKGRGPYRLLKALIDADVVVDIVSGTSAGGINGVLLSYALANDRDFKHCAKLWREHADFQRMLRPVDAKAPSSVLDGEGYFHDRLVDIYRTLPPWTPEPHELKPGSTERKWESKLEALDLFVTGTDYDGEVSTRVDALGHAIDIKDHRKVFKLKYREGRANDFEAAWDENARPGRTRASSEPRVQALATISRCTSSFPGAFPPTVVPEGRTLPPDQASRPSSAPPANPDDEADRLVRTWGNFTKRTDFLDGGVLDNKPFTYTIRDIYMRTAERQVVRKLFYVEPDPERFAPEARPTSPNILNVVLSSLVGIPGYESIAQDLRDVDDRNGRLDRYREITSILRGKRPIADRTDGGTGNDGDAFSFHPSDVQRDIHKASRATQMRDRFVDGIRTSPTWAGPEETATIAALAGRVVEDFNALAPEKRDGLLDRYDVDYAMRRLFYVSYELYDRIYAKIETDPAAHLVNLLAALNRHIQVLKVVQYAVERLRTALSGLPKTIGSATDLWTRVHGMLEALLAWPVQVTGGTGTRAWSTGQTLPDPDDSRAWAQWLPDSRIKELCDGLEARLDGMGDRLKPGTLPDVVETTTTVVEALKADAERILDHLLGDGLDDREIRAAWKAFDEVDAYLFPLEYLSDLQEKDRIEVVRVSPIDAKLGFGRERQGSDKIAGDTLYHFGGFFKRSWRSNDILWGRLDALDLLFECLLTPERVGAAVETTARRDRVKRYLAGSDAPADFEARTVVAQIFPHSPSPVQERIAAWLTDLLAQPGGASTSDRRGELLAKLSPGGEMLETLVWAGQLEIIEEDLPDVIQDAVDETVEWGMTKRVTNRGDAVFERLDVDALVGSVIAQMAGQVIRPTASAVPTPPPGSSLATRVTAFVKTALGITTPARQRLIDDPGDFFGHRYGVGKEDIRRDIPPLILVQTFAHALIVAKNALFAVLGDHHALRGGLARRVVRWALEYPLWLVYALAGLIRRQPGLGALNLTVLLTALAVFAAGFYWRDAIWWTGEGAARHLHKPRVIVFAVVPVFVLAAQFIWLRWTLLARSALDRLFRVVLLVVAAGLVAWGIHGREYEGVGQALWNGASRVLTSRFFYLFVLLPLGLFLLGWRFRLPSRRSREAAKAPPAARGKR